MDLHLWRSRVGRQQGLRPKEEDGQEEEEAKEEKEEEEEEEGEAKKQEDGRGGSGGAAGRPNHRRGAIRRKEAGLAATMREIVHIQAGQCGNQIGAKVPTPIISFYNNN